MAKVKLPDEILSLSGAMGNVIFRTFKKRDGKTETRMYSNPYHKHNGQGGWHRKSKPSKKEVAAREQFSQMAREVSRRIAAGDRRTRKEIWKEVKEEYGARES